MKRLWRSSRVLVAVVGLSVLAPVGCKGGSRGKSEWARWVDNPSTGTRTGDTIKIPELGVVFTVPDTRYVFRSCTEASHTPQGAEKWIPVITCSSTNAGVFDEADPDASESALMDEEESSSSEAELINVTIYATHKTRPLDERAVSWFENQYKQAGLEVEDISYQSDYQKKSGIYAKLHAMEGTTPTREILQFIFPRQDIVFIARVEYPFGDSRAIEQDWSYILWNFDFYNPAEEAAAGEAS